ncbi:Ig-like domain-containing protein [Anaeromicropila herbilytica]|uniref:BIG2 domain-containing protein n=1 Tax=Anaeromicropila herbilytica TaxID=2785025 RepID=A0A7R7IE41_9FIRM|nr:Ig-like domain-containing protein [Anaeromicropila herbilytica]BCN32227.1 hypothetical protein bsdtb5_35220 [Anaeromicropila herbilytica]
MKKNFVKKLACVTAFALTVTSVAPMQASAAKAPKLNATSKTLYVGKKYDFNVSNKPAAKSTYTWTTSSKTVATVTTAGVVTAKKAGSATIKVVIKNAKTKKTTKTLTAKVTVKESAASVKISNPVETVNVGPSVYDFNKTITTKTGGKCTDKVYFVISDDTAGATVDKNGVVSTTKVGEFKIKVVTATSEANFKAGTFTAESEAVLVKVPLAVVGVKQTASNKVQVTFNSDVSKTVSASAFDIENVATHQKLPVNKVTFSTDGKVATLETYLNFTDAKDYTVTYAGKATTLKASVGAVASVQLNTQTVPFGKETALEYSLFDANGVDVTNVSDKTRVTVDVDTTKGYTTSGDNTKKLVLFSKGDTAKVKVTFHTYKYENNTETTYKAEGVVTAVDGTATLGNYDNYTIAKTEPNWSKLTTNNTKLAVGDTDYEIYVKATDSAKNTITSSSLKFDTADKSVLLVNKDTGALTAVKEGTTYVIASYNGNVAWTFPVSVVAKRTAAAVMVKDSKYNLTLSNAHAADDQAKIELQVKDQYGDDFAVGDITPTKTPSTVNPPKFEISGSTITFKAQDAAKGTYSYVFTAQKLSLSVVLNVVEAGTQDSTYRALVSTQAIDNVITDETNVSDKKVTISVGEYKGDVLVGKAAPKSVSITKPDGTVITNADTTFATATVSGGAIEKVANGTYKVEVTTQSNATIATYFVVSDTQVAPTLTEVKKQTSTEKTKDAVAKAVLTIKDADGKELAIESVNATAPAGVKLDALNAGDTIYIKDVTVVQKVGNNNVRFTVTVGVPVTIQ